MKVFKQLVLLLSLFVIAACEQANIEAPTSDYVDDALPPLFKVAFTGGIPASLKLQLNTATVNDAFAISETGAEATGDQLAEFIYPGRNVFRVEANGVVQQVYFYYDILGPVIHVLDVDRNTNTVTGYAEDSGGVASLQLDGQPVSVAADGSFSTAFVNQPINQFVATDNFGYSSTTEFARKDQDFTGISARLNQGGLDFLLGVLEQELGETDFGPIIETLPVTQVSPLPGINLNIRVTQFDLDQPDIDLVVQDDETVDAKIDLYDFDMGIHVWGNIFLIPLNSGAVVHFDRLLIETNYLMDIVDSDLSVALDNTSYSLQGLMVNLLIIPSFTYIDAIISGITNNLINAFEPMIVSIAERVIAPIVSDFIKDIPIELQVTVPGDNEKVNIRAVPEFLDSKDLGITVDLNTRIWAPEPADVPGQLGSLYVAGETPSLGSTTPSGTPFDFGASINSNVINQALYAAHESGITTMTIRPDVYSNATPEGIAVYSAESNNIAQVDAIGMRIEPASAPFVKFMPADQAAGTLGWYDLKLSFDLYKPEWGEFRTLFGVTFNLEVPFEVGATEDGFLSIGIEQLPTIQVSATDDKGLILLPPSFINKTIDYFMPAVLPRLAEELKVIPLPRIYNHSLYMREFWIAGPGNNSLSLAGDLVPYSVTATAAEPSTLLDYQTQNISVKRDAISTGGGIETQTVMVAGGEAILNVEGINPEAARGHLEYRYRVDGGGWSIWKRRDEIHLRRMLAGEHNVEVCSRTVLLKREVSCSTVNFSTTVQ